MSDETKPTEAGIGTPPFARAHRHAAAGMPFLRSSKRPGRRLAWPRARRLGLCRSAGHSGGVARSSGSALPERLPKSPYARTQLAR